MAVWKSFRYDGLNPRTMPNRLFHFLRHFSPAHLAAVLRVLFNLDYGLTRSIMPVFGILNFLAYIVFYYSEKSMGFLDWVPLRIFCIALSFCLVIWTRLAAAPKSLLVYWECVLFVTLPFTQTFLYLINPVHPYWDTSNIFWALFLGIATKTVWLPFHLVVGQFAAHWLSLGLYGPGTLAKWHLLGSMQTTIVFAALAGLGIKIALEIFHRRGMELASATARAQEAEARESEIKSALAELKRREEVIKRFVRPSIFEELKSGSNPIEFKPVMRDLAVMFCDIRDFTRLTETLTAEDKQEYMNQYFSLMTGPIIANGGEVDKFIGDCVMALFPDGNKAVKAATEMRLQLQEFNRQMFAQGKMTIRNGIGIAKGPVMVGNFGSIEKLDRTVIGETVNIASRLESKTKMYHLEVLVTEDIIRDLDGDMPHHRWIDMVQVKGSTRRLKIHEVYGHQPKEVKEYKDATRDLLEKALTIYFQKGFHDAARLIGAMLESVPPHRIIPDELMDSILPYYLAHCHAWIADTTGAWQKIDHWNGVHVFQEK
jgi:class 3 adenylate cyclase